MSVVGILKCHQIQFTHRNFSTASLELIPGKQTDEIYTRCPWRRISMNLDSRTLQYIPNGLWKLTHLDLYCYTFLPSNVHVRLPSGVCTFFITVISHLLLYPVTTSLLAMIFAKMCTVLSVHGNTCALLRDMGRNIGDDRISKSFSIAYI